jgi:ABC-2 type transport system permease protein
LTLRTALLYNPRLVPAWFIATGTLGTLIVLHESLVSVATIVREKETGTVEQIRMTPTSALDVVAAKMVPVFVLLMGMVVLVLTLAGLVFGVPFRGGMWLFVTASALCVLTGISIGTLGVEVMYPEVLSPLASTVVLVGIILWRLRRELGCGRQGAILARSCHRLQK